MILIDFVGKCRLNKNGCECASGYTGVICEEQCPEGTWGLGCKKGCECNGQICNHITGECDCPDGAECNDSCPAGSFLYISFFFLKF